MQKVQTAWIVKNKSGKLMIFIKEPTRDIDNGIWKGDIYLNSVLYNQMSQMLQQSEFSWDNDPEPIEFGFISLDDE